MQRVRRISFITAPFGVFLLLIMLAFEAIPVVQPSAANAIYQAGLQGTRSQVITKDMLILETQTDQESRSQAISDLQVLLPLFEQEQSTLTSYRLTDVNVLMSNARSDYLALDAAVKATIANSNKSVDKTQVDIVLAHNTSYLHTMNQVVVALQGHVDDENLHLFIIEAIIDGLLILLSIIFFFVIKSITKTYKENL